MTTRDDEPWSRLVLDEAFVKAARHQEAAAWERTRVSVSPRVGHREGGRAGDARGRPRGRRDGRRALLISVLAVTVVVGVSLGRGSERVTSPGGDAAPRVALKARTDVAAPRHTAEEAEDPSHIGDVWARDFSARDSSDVAPVPRWPSPQRAASRLPLGTPPPAPEQTGPFRFGSHQRDGERPVTYDPCRPLRYVVNDRTAPPGGDLLLAEAVDMIGAATGLRFEEEGLTDESPSSDREPFQPDRYGDRWAPILISWSDEAATAELTGHVAGIGGSASVVRSQRDPQVYVTGIVTLDGPQLEQLLSGPDGPRIVRGVILHELGHLVGLAHVEDPSQLMAADGPASELAAGDLTGLAQLGTGPCMSTL